MSVSLVLRPRHILTSPRLLADALGAKLRTHEWARRNERSVEAHRGRSGLFTYGVGEYSPESVQEFGRLRKLDQRRSIASYGVSVPETYSGGNTRWVVRPHRHSQGVGFRVTEDPDDFNPQSEYISPLFPKQYEYRLIFIKGAHLITLVKVVNDGTPADIAWNHGVSRFSTIHDYGTCRLRHTNCLGDLAAHPVVQEAHILGVDVMLDADRNYAVCEFNLAPALTIENNLNKVVEYLTRDNA